MSDRDSSGSLRHAISAVLHAYPVPLTDRPAGPERLIWRADESDSGQQRWLANRGIDLLRGTDRLVGTGVVEVEGIRPPGSTSSWRPAQIR